MKVLVFSKDRPMQLDAYLASLLHFSGLPQSAVTVLLCHDSSYQPLSDAYPAVNWLTESTGFHAALEHWTEGLDHDEHVLFGCDDVVYFRELDPAAITRYLAAHPDILGFSLRLGTNIEGAHAITASAGDRNARGNTRGDTHDGIVTWPVEQHRRHWGYPFELMGTVYRASLVKQVIRGGGKFRVPNDLEAIGNRMCRSDRSWWLKRFGRWIRGYYRDFERLTSNPRLAMSNGPSYCAAQDVNRVQTVVANSVQGTEQHAAAQLKARFAAGARLDWKRLSGITPSDCFVGQRYWSEI